uniref:Venom allergen-1 n=1 Tax=Psorophora albipes TaxID=869069 RepID=T1E2W5_9DIPT
MATVCSGQTTNYCDASLCTKGTHIACNGLTTLSSSCGAGAAESVLDASAQAQILDEHNKLRNTVAMGQQNYTATEFYKQAARMATLQWDSELASIAAANARRCVYGHDACRNTATMKFVGQNIAIQQYYGMTKTDSQLITEFVQAWFSEYQYANPGFIDSYPQGYTGPAIGHFTQVVSDRSSKVGCSLVSYEADGWTNKLFVCNYGLTNMVNQPVYVAGNTASQCTTGSNPSYSGLCSVNEVVANNP